MAGVVTRSMVFVLLSPHGARHWRRHRIQPTLAHRRYRPHRASRPREAGVGVIAKTHALQSSSGIVLNDDRGRS